MTELLEKKNDLNATNTKDLFAKLALFSTAAWGLLCLFGLLYHWGLMAGLGIPEDFFPVPFQMLPVKAYLAFMIIINWLAELNNDDTFMAFPAAFVGVGTLVVFYLASSERIGKFRSKFNKMRKQAKEHADRHQFVDVCVSIFLACMVYLGPRVIVIFIGILILLPASGYYIGKGRATDSSLEDARLCLEDSDHATAGCIELTDVAGRTARGYILAQSEDFIAWYTNGSVEIRPLDKAATYKVIMKPLNSDERNKMAKEPEMK